MSLEAWLAFTAASAILCAIPGPTVLLIISYSIAHGRRMAAAIVAGTALGDFVAMTASLLGLGAVLAASAALFTVLKWAGAAYLVYLGVMLWRAPVADQEAAPPPADPRRAFGHAFAVTALNPKGIVFFVAFLPQFLDPGRPMLPQLLICEATFLAVATANAVAYALLGSAARGAVRRPALRRAVNRVGGSLLIGAGLATAAARRG